MDATPNVPHTKVAVELDISVSMKHYYVKLRHNTQTAHRWTDKPEKIKIAEYKKVESVLME